MPRRIEVESWRTKPRAGGTTTHDHTPSSGLAATRHEVLGAIERILAGEIERLTLRLAGVASAATG